MCSSCCHSQNQAKPKRWWEKPDWLFSLCAPIVGVSYLLFWLVPDSVKQVSVNLYHFGHGVFDLLNTMWWGVLFGIAMLSLLTRIPRELVIGAFGAGGGVKGLARATAAGVLLDLCSHGILMVGSKLYGRII